MVGTQIWVPSLVGLHKEHEFGNAPERGKCERTQLSRSPVQARRVSTGSVGTKRKFRTDHQRLPPTGEAWAQRIKEDAGLDEETTAWAEDNQRKQEKMYEFDFSLLTMAPSEASTKSRLTTETDQPSPHPLIE